MEEGRTKKELLIDAALFCFFGMLVTPPGWFVGIGLFVLGRGIFTGDWRLE